MAETLLPSAFAELEEFAQTWCLPTEAERWNQRLVSTMAEMREFYYAFFPRLEEAIEYCDKFSLDDMPEDAVHLLHLIYSLVMVAMAVEIFGQPKPTDSADAVLDRVGEPVP
jgi:RimJ/RimL family protein N-acetyltransferase